MLECEKSGYVWTESQSAYKKYPGTFGQGKVTLVCEIQL